MKKKIYILALIVTLLSSVYTSKAEAIVTFMGSDSSRYYDDLEERKASVSINVDGIILDTGQKILIRGTTHILSEPFDKVTKKELLDSIRHQMTELQLNYKYELLDFASDAKLYNNGKLLFSTGDDEGTVKLEGGIRKYQLNGHVILKEIKEPELTNPSESARIEYRVKFSPSINGELTGKYLFPIEFDLGEKLVGEKLTSQELRKKAEEVLEKNYPDFKIVEKEYTFIIHNENGEFQKYASFKDDFEYEIAKRNKILYTKPKTGKILGETQSVDRVKEGYIVEYKK
ncbi:staphylokinase domain-containing protein [Helcococcus ovis]|uniref:staphylokinase domain-containing protein n=1 Tax=Helcococcus ovis TaxID=72026 RepID=UPI0038BC8CFB